MSSHVRLLEHLLGLRVSELRPVLRLSLVYALLSGAMVAGDTVVQSVFLARVGADRLPDVLLLRAVGSPLLALLYARLARPRPVRSTLLVLTLAVGGLELVAMQAMQSGTMGAVGAYALHEIATGLITVHWGVYLLAHVDGDLARRSVPLIYAGGRAGAALTGVVLTALLLDSLAGRVEASAVDIPGLMVIVAGLFALSAVVGLWPRPTVGRPAPRDSIPDAEDEAHRPSSPPQAREGIRLARRSRLLLWIAIGVALMVFVRYALRYQQQAVLDDFGEAQLAGLLAGYAAAANAGAAVLQVVVLGRILARGGITRINSLYPLLAGAAQILLLLRPGLGAAFLGRLVDQELKHVLRTPVSSLFYEGFEHAQRGAARALTLGVVSPAAQIAAALALKVVASSSQGHLLPVLGVLSGAAFIAATSFQNRAYERVLGRDNVRPKSS